MKYFIKYGLATLCVTFQLAGMEHGATIPVPTAEVFIMAVDNKNFEMLRSCGEAAASGYLDLTSHLDKVSKALILAARYGHTEVVRELLKVPGIDVNAIDKNGVTALIGAAEQGHSETVSQLLKVPGIDVNAKTETGRTALILASVYSRTIVVKELLKVPGIDVNTKDKDGYTALMFAAWRGHTEVVRELLKAPGIDVNAKTETGRAAFMMAAWGGHTETVRELLRTPGIDVNAKEKDDYTALMMAATKGRTETVSQLLKVPGIDVNAKKDMNETALMLAARQGHTEVVKLLTAVGAYTDSLTDIKDQSNKVEDAIDEGKLLYAKILSALKSGNREMLHQAIEQGYSFNIRDGQGNGVMHIILDSNEFNSEEQRLDMIKWLYAYAPGLATIENNLGENAVHSAVKLRAAGGGSDILIWLVEAGYRREESLLRQLIRQASRQKNERLAEVQSSIQVRSDKLQLNL